MGFNLLKKIKFKTLLLIHYRHLKDLIRLFLSKLFYRNTIFEYPSIKSIPTNYRQQIINIQTYLLNNNLINKIGNIKIDSNIFFIP